jgi:hypothetical protein
MKVLNEVVVVLHLLGMAAIVGGWLVVRRDPRLVPSILWGARAQLLTGLVLAGIASMDKEDPPNNAKLGVKLVVALVVLALAETARIREARVLAPAGSGSAGSPAAVAPVAPLVRAVGWLAVLNVLIAVLWRSYS